MSFYFPAVLYVYKERFDGSIQSAGFYVADFVICAKCVLRYVCMHTIQRPLYCYMYIYVYIYTVNGKNKDTPCFPDKTIPSEKCKEYVKHICNGLSSIFRNFFEFYVQGWMFWFRYFNTKYKKMYRIKLSCSVWIT